MYNIIIPVIRKYSSRNEAVKVCITDERIRIPFNIIKVGACTCTGL